MSRAAFKIPCPVCGKKTLAERTIRGLATRFCPDGHKAQFKGSKWVRDVVTKPKSRIPCWCKLDTMHMPTCKVMAFRGDFIEVVKRVCPKGHRSWFTRELEGNKFLCRVKERSVKAKPA